jgi:uncharacterized phage protein (TIGR01671 family)
MQREIKFRAWDKENKKMFVGEWTSLYFDRKFRWFLYDGEDLGGDLLCNFQKGQLMQYTGLDDKNGIRIYEGDILEGQFSNFTNLTKDTELVRAEVVFKEGMFCIEYKELHTGTTYRKLLDLSCFVIIGNIYQDPELLTEYNI